jgi:methylated-DNA-protein-cysteine methyltransferase-like protein
MHKQISETYERIYQIVRQIPEGKVATYGQIAELAGFHGQARLVGYALHCLTDEMDVPWHRVINARAKISSLPDPMASEIQRRLLESEGIVFDADDRIDLKKVRWKPSEF